MRCTHRCYLNPVVIYSSMIYICSWLHSGFSVFNVNLLRPSDVIIWVNISSGNGLLPGGTKPMLAYHQVGAGPCTWEQFHSTCSRIEFEKIIRKVHPWIYCHITQSQLRQYNGPDVEISGTTDGYLWIKHCIVMMVAINSFFDRLPMCCRIWFTKYPSYPATWCGDLYKTQLDYLRICFHTSCWYDTLL